MVKAGIENRDPEKTLDYFRHGVASAGEIVVFLEHVGEVEGKAMMKKAQQQTQPDRRLGNCETAGRTRMDEWRYFAPASCLEDRQEAKIISIEELVAGGDGFIRA